MYQNEFYTFYSQKNRITDTPIYRWFYWQTFLKINILKIEDKLLSRFNLIKITDCHIEHTAVVKFSYGYHFWISYKLYYVYDFLLLAIACVGVTNRCIHRLEHEVSPRTHRSGNTKRFKSTAFAVRRMVLYESQWQVRPLRETSCRQGIGVLGIFVQDQHINLWHVSRWGNVSARYRSVFKF